MTIKFLNHETNRINTLTGVEKITDDEIELRFYLASKLVIIAKKSITLTDISND